MEQVEYYAGRRGCFKWRRGSKSAISLGASSIPPTPTKLLFFHLSRCNVFSDVQIVLPPIDPSSQDSITWEFDAEGPEFRPSSSHCGCFVLNTSTMSFTRGWDPIKRLICGITRQDKMVPKRKGLKIRQRSVVKGTRKHVRAYWGGAPARKGRKVT